MSSNDASEKWLVISHAIIIERIAT